MGVAGMTGLGNPSPEMMSGESTGNEQRDELIRRFSEDVYKTFFQGTKLDYNGVDAGVREFEVRAGIEPTYMYESLKMVSIHEEKGRSYLVEGYAWGPYGSGIRQKRRYYRDYKRGSKFTYLVDLWHPLLFPKNV